MKSHCWLFLVAVTTCSAQTFTNTFDSYPPLGGADPGGSSPGLWYVDRFAPATFGSAYFLGDNRLSVGVSAADYHGGTFYDTQGRKYYLTNSGVGSSVSAQLYIPSAWASMNVGPSLWLTAYDINSQPSGYPIVGFYSDGTGDSYFRVWDDISGYVNLNTPIDWNSWNTFSINFTTAGFVYAINGVDVFTDIGAVGSVSIANVMFQDKNYGTSYNAYWDNLITPSSTDPYAPIPVPEPSSAGLLSLGGALIWGMQKLRRARQVAIRI